MIKKKKEENNYSVSLEFISKKRRRKVKNILISYILKIIFTIHEKTLNLNQIVSRKKICASQKSVYSDASSFLPPKLISTRHPSFKSRSLQKVHNCSFIPCHSLKYLLEIETLCFYSEYKEYIKSPKEQGQETHGSKSQIQKQLNPFLIK